MKYILSLILITSLASCGNSFINHELKVEKVGDCSQPRGPLKMESNINGERYQFELCLSDGYSGKDYQVERKGDSLIVRFPEPSAKTALYKLILDIDAKPAYHHIVLDGKEITVVPSER